MDDIKQFIISNWSSAEAMRTLLGKEYPRNDQFHFGSIPTEQASIEVTEGRITRITTWSGLNWSAHSGYGKPRVDIYIGKPKQFDSTPF